MIIEIDGTMIRIGAHGVIQAIYVRGQQRDVAFVNGGIMVKVGSKFPYAAMPKTGANVVYAQF